MGGGAAPDTRAIHEHHGTHEARDAQALHGAHALPRPPSPPRSLSVAECYAAAGSSDSAAALRRVVAQYNELLSEYAALSVLYHSLADQLSERVDPGAEEAPPPSLGNRFRLLRRRSARSVRDVWRGTGGHLQGVGAAAASQFAGQVAHAPPAGGSMSPVPPTAVSVPDPVSPTLLPRSAFLGSVLSFADRGEALLHREPSTISASGPSSSSSVSAGTATTSPYGRPRSPTQGVPSSPKLWRKTSGPVGAGARVLESSPQRAAPWSPTSPRAEARLVFAQKASPPGAPRSGTAPGRPAHDELSHAQLPHDPLGGAGVRTVGTSVRRSPGADTLAVRIHVGGGPASGAAMPPGAPLVVEKTCAELAATRERIHTRALGLADTTTPPIELPDAALFHAPVSPAQLVARNAAVDAFVQALQRLPMWYDDIVSAFLTTNVVRDEGAAERGTKSGYLLWRASECDAWALRHCTLSSHVFLVRETERGLPLARVDMAHARAAVQQETQWGAAAGADLRMRYPVLQLHDGVPEHAPMFLAAEAADHLGDWLTAIARASPGAVVPGETAEPPGTGSARSSTHTPSTPYRDHDTDAAAGLWREQAASPSPRPRHAEPRKPMLTGLVRHGRASYEPRASPLLGSPGAPADRRRFWHGLLGFSQSAPDAPADAPPLFGAPLATAVQYTGVAVEHCGGAVVPGVVKRCIDYLEQCGGLHEEGIYRLSGSSSAVRALQERFTTTSDVDIVAEAAAQRGQGMPPIDPHVVSNVLKTYLRALPENVCTAALLPEFAQAADAGESAERHAHMRRLLDRLPPENYAVLRVLCRHLHLVVACSDRNKMTLQNACIVLSPTLVMPTVLLSVLVTTHESLFSRAPAAQTPYSAAAPYDAAASDAALDETPLERGAAFARGGSGRGGDLGALRPPPTPASPPAPPALFPAASPELETTRMRVKSMSLRTAPMPARAGSHRHGPSDTSLRAVTEALQDSMDGSARKLGTLPP
ncbi:Rho GTPase activating protein [Malassezia sp. CBS 17886]|nr:Rho GTPase activating protein [Malassezia sp. CBS 17886]